MIRFKPFSRSRDLVNSERRLAATSPCVSTLLGRLQPGRRTCFYRDQRWKSQGAYFNTCPGALSALSPNSTQPPLLQFITNTTNTTAAAAAATPSGPLCLGPVPKASEAYSSHGGPLQINPRDGNQPISEQNTPASHNALNLPLIIQRRIHAIKSMRFDVWVWHALHRCIKLQTSFMDHKRKSNFHPWLGGETDPHLQWVWSASFLSRQESVCPPSLLEWSDQSQRPSCTQQEETVHPSKLQWTDKPGQMCQVPPAQGSHQAISNGHRWTIFHSWSSSVVFSEVRLSFQELFMIFQEKKEVVRWIIYCEECFHTQKSMKKEKAFLNLRFLNLSIVHRAS